MLIRKLYRTTAGDPSLALGAWDTSLLAASRLLLRSRLASIDPKLQLFVPRHIYLRSRHVVTRARFKTRSISSLSSSWVLVLPCLAGELFLCAMLLFHSVYGCSCTPCHHILRNLEHPHSMVSSRSSVVRDSVRLINRVLKLLFCGFHILLHSSEVDRTAPSAFHLTFQFYPSPLGFWFQSPSSNGQTANPQASYISFSTLFIPAMSYQTIVIMKARVQSRWQDVG